MKLPEFSPERLSAVQVDPDLMLVVLEEIADTYARRSRKKEDVFALCAAAYIEFAGVDARHGLDSFSANDMQAIAALVSRLAAMSELGEQGHLKPDQFPVEVMAEAACTAQLVTGNGGPGFQLLDFLAHVERANKRPRKW